MVPPLETLPVSRELGRTVGLHLVDAAYATDSACRGRSGRRSQSERALVVTARLPALLVARGPSSERADGGMGGATRTSPSHTGSPASPPSDSVQGSGSPHDTAGSRLSHAGGRRAVSSRETVGEGRTLELTGVVLAVLYEMERGRQHRRRRDPELVDVRDVLGHRILLKDATSGRGPRWSPSVGGR
jgi:hypothetical protein